MTITACDNLVVDANSDTTTHTALVFYRPGVGWIVECGSCTYGAWNCQRSGAIDAARTHLEAAHDAT